MEIDVAPSPNLQLAKPMEVDPVKSPPPPKTLPGSPSGEVKASECLPEPDFFAIENLTRVTPAQRTLVRFPPAGATKFRPVSGLWRGEVIVVVDTDSSRPVDYIERSNIKVTSTLLADEENEPEPPEPFECPEI